MSPRNNNDYNPNELPPNVLDSDSSDESYDGEINNNADSSDLDSESGSEYNDGSEDGSVYSGSDSDGSEEDDEIPIGSGQGGVDGVRGRPDVVARQEEDIGVDEMHEIVNNLRNSVNELEADIPRLAQRLIAEQTGKWLSFYLINLSYPNYSNF